MPQTETKTDTHADKMASEDIGNLCWSLVSVQCGQLRTMLYQSVPVSGSVNTPLVECISDTTWCFENPITSAETSVFGSRF